MSGMRIDVALVLYRRPEHTARVLDSLVDNGVEHVRAFLDHADSPADVERQAELRRLLDAQKHMTIDLYQHERRQGLAHAVRFAVDSVLSDADAVVVVEDDCVLRDGAFEFFTEGLRHLRSDRRVQSLCGYVLPCSFVGDENEILLLRRFLPWGWATWRDRWARFRASIGTTAMPSADEEGPAEDLMALARAAAAAGPGRADVWSVPWVLAHYREGTFVACPRSTLIDNIGFDGSGVHCPPTRAFDTPHALPRPVWDWSRLVHREQNDRIVDEFLGRHGAMMYGIAQDAD